METVIYYTKEDGINKVLDFGMKNQQSSIDVDESDLRYATKILGHKPTNLYFFYQGKEFKYPLKIIGKPIEEIRSWYK